MSQFGFRLIAIATLLALGGPRLRAWSPRFHEAQTALAVRLLPRGMNTFLNAHRQDLMQGARGKSNDQVPTVEDVEAQFQRIVLLTEQRRRPDALARELGILAHQVQLLMDPSAVVGSSLLRDAFEAYSDEKLSRMVLSREPFWAVTAPLDPRPALLHWAKVKFGRNQALQNCFDEQQNRRVGAWDELSVPFAQSQLAYSNGIHATTNLWILLWRAVGDQWEPPQNHPAFPNR